jgi:hypothetical protein
MAKMGRPSIFAPKSPKHRRQGIMTPAGSKLFEVARKRLGQLAKMDPKKISDGDVFEFLARGEEATRAYLAK